MTTLNDLAEQRRTETGADKNAPRGLVQGG